MVGSDIEQDSMLGKYMDDKYLCQLCGSDNIECQNKDSLLGELIDYDKDYAKARRRQKFLNEVYRY